jgi:tRNA dimethylallyltransferase
MLRVLHKLTVMHKRYILLIAGPTAVGKTAMAVQLAHRLNTEVISADSRQCYREMKIGVARPSEDELKKVPHHFIATHSIQEEVTAATFEQYALHKAEQLFQEKQIVILAGGTGLYVRAFLNGLDSIPAVSLEIRSQCVSAYKTNGKEWLIDELRKKDVLYAATGDLQNPQRMLRALEVWEGTGKSILSFQEGNKQSRPFEVIRIGLDLPRQELYARINQRVLTMIENGLANEVQSLLPFAERSALQTVGYKELIAYFRKELSLERAIELIQQNTRHYAKRQLTWFRNQEQCNWFLPDQEAEIIAFLKSRMQ